MTRLFCATRSIRSCPQSLSPKFLVPSLL